VRSKDFGIQTVGRILRMPHQRHYENDALNYGYVYTNIESNSINFVPADVDYFNYQIAERKQHPEWCFEKLTTANVINDRASKGLLNSTFEKMFFDLMEAKYGIKQLPELDIFSSEEDSVLKTTVAANHQAMKNKLWIFEIDDHQIHIPTNIEIDPYEVSSMILSANQVQNFAITTAEFTTMFDRFCYDSITRLNRSKSWKKLRETLIHFAEYYLNIFEFEAHKLFLYPHNNGLLIEHITKVLEAFEAMQTAIGNDKRRLENSEWEVPELRYYSEQYSREEIESHALKPFFENNNASNPEKAFKAYLKANEAHISWWYKNGDSGKEHFAVPYTDSFEVLRLFYVDFVIKLKSGKIGLFDTKTKRSDPEAPNKHNALLKYMEEQNVQNTERQLVGGIVISEDIGGEIKFKYCTNRISDTNDTRGWDFLNLQEMNK